MYEVYVQLSAVRLFPVLFFFRRRYLHCPHFLQKQPVLPRSGGKYLHCLREGQKTTCAANFFFLLFLRITPRSVPVLQGLGQGPRASPTARHAKTLKVDASEFHVATLGSRNSEQVFCVATHTRHVVIIEEMDRWREQMCFAGSAVTRARGGRPETPVPRLTRCL